MEKRYQVFVSSTFDDLKEERKAIIECLLNAKFIPAGMELFSASNDEQFEYIKKIIDTCDYYVLIIAARYGSINPSTGLSFTEQEYNYAKSKGIPILAFLHSDPYNLPYNKREDDKREQLEQFRKKASSGRLCKMWSNLAELTASVLISINEQVNENPQKGWIRSDSLYSADYNQVVERLNKDNIVLKDKLEHMQIVITELKEELETSEKDRYRLQTEITELTSKLDYSEKAKNDLQTRITELNTNLDSSERVKNNLSNTITEISKQLERRRNATEKIHDNESIFIMERVCVRYRNGSNEGKLYTTWKEILVKSKDNLAGGCSLEDINECLSRDLINGNGRIDDKDVERIIKYMIDNRLWLKINDRLLILSYSGKKMIKLI